MPNKQSGTGFAICIIIGIVILAMSSGGLFTVDDLGKYKEKVAELGWVVVGISFIILFAPDIASKLNFG